MAAISIKWTLYNGNGYITLENIVKKSNNDFYSPHFPKSTPDDPCCVFSGTMAMWLTRETN